MSDMIRFHCRACGKRLKASRELAGRNARCSCGEPHSIPTHESGAIPSWVHESNAFPAGGEPTESRKPVVERNRSNALAKVEGVRDQVHQSFLNACAGEKVEALVLRSHPFSPTVWVKFECWVPHTSAKGLSDRSSAVLTIRPREFH